MTVWIDQRRQAGGLWRTPLRDRVPGVEHGEDKLVLRNVVEELISVPFLKRQDKKEKGQDDKVKARRKKVKTTRSRQEGKERGWINNRMMPCFETNRVTARAPSEAFGTEPQGRKMTEWMERM